jgi:AbrB family looped-hinge helix DNA binding protein
MSNRLTSKGQVTIPKRLRDHLGLKPGSEVDFALGDNGKIIVSPVRGKRKQAPNPFAKIRGSATVKMTTDQIMALTRGED